MIAEGFFSPEEPGRYRELVERLLDHDPFLLLADFAAYVQAQDRVDAAFKDAEGWTRMAVLNTARLDRFCIDRTVFEYAEKIWGVAAHCYIEGDPQIADSKDW
jgi:starch phosphorylase